MAMPRGLFALESCSGECVNLAADLWIIGDLQSDGWSWFEIVSWISVGCWKHI
jgi:hypothetical protein